MLTAKYLATIALVLVAVRPFASVQSRDVGHQDHRGEIPMPFFVVSRPALSRASEGRPTLVGVQSGPLGTAEEADQYIRSYMPKVMNVRLPNGSSATIVPVRDWMVVEATDASEAAQRAVEIARGPANRVRTASGIGTPRRIMLMGTLESVSADGSHVVLRRTAVSGDVESRRVLVKPTVHVTTKVGRVLRSVDLRPGMFVIVTGAQGADGVLDADQIMAMLSAE